MEPTHFEKMFSGPFQVKGVLEELRKELPVEGLTWEAFISCDFLKESNKRFPFQSQYITTCHLLYHIYCYYYGMGRTYEIMPGLADLLLSTDLDVDSRVLKSPFPEIQLIVPPVLQIHDKCTGFHSLQSIYVNLREETTGAKLLRVLCVGKYNENSLNEYDDALYYFKIPFHEGKVGACLEKEMNAWRMDARLMDYATDENLEMVPRMFRFVLNILLYITSGDADIQEIRSERIEMEKRLQGLHNAAKIRKLSHRIDRMSGLHRFVVGRSIKLSAEEESVFEAIHHGKHTIRYPVAGYWRMQWYGHSESQVQKLRWVRPHFRGPELAEVIKNIGVIK